MTPHPHPASLRTWPWPGGPAAGLATARIRRAWPHEAPALGALALRAQATWGYAPDELRAFAELLRVPPEALAGRRGFVLEAAGRVAGFSVLTPAGEDAAQLRHLFVEPAFMGRGFGSRLLEHARAEVRRRGGRRLLVQSDLHAERFYLLRGGVRLRLQPLQASALPGLRLALLEIRL